MILYLETNFIMGAAMGRDASADFLLRHTSAELRIALPAVCLMEAWSSFEDEQSLRMNRREGTSFVRLWTRRSASSFVT